MTVKPPSAQAHTCDMFSQVHSRFNRVDRSQVGITVQPTRSAAASSNDMV